MSDGSVSFGMRRVGRGHPAVVVAEIGINHEGDAATCQELVRAAAQAGADAVKLQTIVADENYVPGTESYAIFGDAELSLEETGDMFALARDLGMEAFTTAGDAITLALVDGLQPAAHKISSGLLTHLPLIQQAAQTGRTVVISTGMAGLDEIDPAVRAAREARASGLVLLQCTSEYPAPPGTLNLAAIRTLETRFEVPVGFSDHSLGIDAPPLAVGAGAVMVEKHLTLDTSRRGFDHAISLPPDDFARMVERIRQAESMFGSGEKRPTPQEQANAERFRRSLVARREIPAGSTLERDDVGVMRTPPEIRGLPPSALETVIGMRSRRRLSRFEPLLGGDLVDWDDGQGN